MNAKWMLLAAATLAFPAGARAQDGHQGHATRAHPSLEEGVDAENHDAMDHDAMDHGAPATRSIEHSQTEHAAPAPGGAHAGHGGSVDTTLDLPTEPPAAALAGPAHAADAIWGEAAMRGPRRAFYDSAGGMTYGALMAERLETRLGDEDGYLWDIQAYHGGDIDKFVLKSEGEGVFGEGFEEGDVQALWSHAITPWFDLQAGLRQDLRGGGRTHAVLGVEGLAPYNLEVDAAAFLSDKGDLTASMELEYDQKVTQDLILQPRVEVGLSAQSIPEFDTGSGVAAIEAGLRLRYRIVPEFAPYIGYDLHWKLGDTRAFVLARGEDPSTGAIVVGLRTWF